MQNLPESQTRLSYPAQYPSTNIKNEIEGENYKSKTLEARVKLLRALIRNNTTTTVHVRRVNTSLVKACVQRYVRQPNKAWMDMDMEIWKHLDCKHHPTRLY